MTAVWPVEKSESEVSGFVVDVDAGDSLVKHDAWKTSSFGDQEPRAAKMADVVVCCTASQVTVTARFTALHWRRHLTPI